MKRQLEIFGLVGYCLASLGCMEAPIEELPENAAPSSRQKGPGWTSQVGAALLCDLLSARTTFEQVTQSLGPARNMEIDGETVSLVYPYQGSGPGRPEEMVLVFSRTNHGDGAAVFRLQSIVLRFLQDDGSRSIKALQCAEGGGVDDPSSGATCRSGADEKKCPTGWVCSGGRCLPERLPPVSTCAKNFCLLEPKLP